MTEVAIPTIKALRFALDEKATVKITGDSRFGKTETVKKFCEAYPGQSRLVRTPCSNADRDLLAAIAEAVGIEVTVRTSPRQLRSSVELVKRVAAGQGTAAEISQVSDWQTQAHFAQTGAGDLSTVAGNARAALSNARSAVQSGRGNDGQLHDLMNEFIGMARDIHASAAQRHEFNDLERQVETLRAQIANSRTIH